MRVSISIAWAFRPMRSPRLISQAGNAYANIVVGNRPIQRIEDGTHSAVLADPCRLRDLFEGFFIDPRLRVGDSLLLQEFLKVRIGCRFRTAK